MNKQYDIAVLVGRYQPIHKGHIPAFQKAEQIAHKTVCVIGSINKPSTPKNPFSFEERKMMVINALANENIDTTNVSIFGVEDSFYQEQEWYRSVRWQIQPVIALIKQEKQEKVDAKLEALGNKIDSLNGLTFLDEMRTAIALHGINLPITALYHDYLNYTAFEPEVRIAILGYEKDASSYYLNSFSDWDFVPVEDVTKGKPLSATKIRELWLDDTFSYAKSNLHPYTYDFMAEYPMNEFLALHDEYAFLIDYKADTQTGPFPVQFLATDAVVVHGDEILLIRRGGEHGKGLWALPGGFKDSTETFFDSCVRELQEETKIDVPEKVIRGSLKDEKMFDFPSRSARGTVVSMAYLFVLDPTRPRPRVRGADDAVQAWWFSLSEVEGMTSQLFEDHPDIIKYMTARI